MNWDNDTVREMLECTMDRTTRAELPAGFTALRAAESENFLAAAKLWLEHFGGAHAGVLTDTGMKEEVHTELIRLRNLEATAKAVLANLCLDGTISETDMLDDARTCLEKVLP